MKITATNRRIIFSILLIISFMVSLPGATPAAAIPAANNQATITPQIVNPVEPKTVVSQQVQPNLSPEVKLKRDTLLTKWIETGQLPELVRHDELGVHIMFLTSNPDVSLGGLVHVVTTVNIAGTYSWVHATVKDRHTVKLLFNRADVSMLSADLDYHKLYPAPTVEEYQARLQDYPVGTSDNLGPITRKLIGADIANQYSTGKGIIVAPTDTGQDFGTTGLLGKMAIDANGYPMSYGAASSFLAITSATFTVDETHEIQTKGMEDQIYVTISAFSSSSLYTLAKLNELHVGKFLLADKYHVPNEIPANAKVKFGVIFDRNGPYMVATPFLLADTMQSVPGYDTLYIDYKTGLYFSEYALLNKATATEYLQNAPNDFDPTTNPYAKRHGYFPGLTPEERALNYTLAADINGDGYTDISFGSLSNTLDTANITGWGPATGKSPLVRMIDPDGKAIALLFDEQGHGTSVAAQIAGNAVKFPVFDWDRTYSSLDSPNVNMTLQGIAPDARILGLGGFYSGDLLSTWLWAAGFDPVYNANKNAIEFQYTGNHEANISSNSWGFTSPTIAGYWPGADIYSLMLQMLSLPQGLDPNYPGLLFVIAYGNQGPGYGTGGSPIADVAIGVGASSAQNYLAWSLIPPYAPEQTHHDQVGWFSSKGPDGDLYPKVDIMNTGAYDFGYAVTEVGNGTYSFTVFGGTSQATPMTSGSLALLYQAYKDVTGNGLRPDVAKTILMSTASDLGYDPFSQGSGRVNISRAIEYVYGLNNTAWATPLLHVYNTKSHNIEMQRILTSLRYYFTTGTQYENQGTGVDRYSALNITDTFNTYANGVYQDTALFFGTVMSEKSAVVNVEASKGASIQSFELYTYNVSEEATATMAKTKQYFNFYKLTDLFPNVDFASADLAAFIFNTPERAGKFDLNYWAYLGILRDKNGNGTLDLASGDKGEFELVTRSLSNIGTFTVWLSLENITSEEINKMYFFIRDLLYDDPSTKADEHVQGYDGVSPVVTVRTFKKAAAPGLSAVAIANGLNVTVDPAGVEPGAHSAFLKITSSSGVSTLVPISYSVPLKVQNGQTAGDWTTLQRDNLNEPYDWDLYPANGGDMRFFELVLDGATNTEKANTLALELNWTGPESHVAFWLADPAFRTFLSTDYFFGDLTPDISFTGNANPNGYGYRYLVNLTQAAEFYGYNLDSSFKIHVALLLDRIDPNVQGVIHVTFKAAWFTGVLGKDIQFPVVEFTGSVPSGVPATHEGMLLTTGDLTVNVTKDTTGLPEPFATDFSVKRYPVDLTISVTQEIHLSHYFIPASKLKPTSGTPSWEYQKALQLTAGMKVYGVLDWADSSQDWDLFLLSDPTNIYSDVFKFQSATLNKPEIGTGAIDADGTYYVSVDFYGGPKEDSYIWLDFIASKALVSESINANGQTVTLNEQGEFLVTAHLYGLNIPEFEIKVEVDNAPPAITPYYNAEINGNEAVIGKIFDETNVTATIKFDGATIANNINFEGKYEITVAASKFTGYENHTVEVTATDYLGRTSTLTWNTHKADTEPPQITTPPSDKVVTPGTSVTLKWVVSDNAGGTYTIYVNGNLVKNGNFNSGQDTISYTFSSST